jgi:hypothetical protein
VAAEGVAQAAAVLEQVGARPNKDKASCSEPLSAVLAQLACSDRA